MTNKDITTDNNDTNLRAGRPVKVADGAFKDIWNSKDNVPDVAQVLVDEGIYTDLDKAIPYCNQRAFNLRKKGFSLKKYKRGQRKGGNDRGAKGRNATPSRGKCGPAATGCSFRSQELARGKPQGRP